MTHDPTAATAPVSVPREREAPRPIGWMRSRRDTVQVHPQIAEAVGQALDDLERTPVTLAAPLERPDLAQQAAIAAVTAPVEDEPTDPGLDPVPVVARPKVHPYADLPYETRVCRLLEDIADNTRKTEAWLAGDAHRLRVAQAEQLLHPPKRLEHERMALVECVRAWLLDPQLKGLVVKALVVGTTAGGSVAGGASTMMLAMELVERLLRAWVSLP